MRHEVASRVTGVGGQQHLSTTGDFLGDLVGVDVVVVLLRERNGDGSNLPETVSKGITRQAMYPSSTTHVLEQRQHLRVRRVIGNGERQVRVTQDRSNTDQTRTTTRHNADILPGVLALLALTVVVIVQTSNGRAQRLDTGGRTVLPSSGGDGIDVGRGKLPSISSSASGAPWPRLAQPEGSSA